MLLELELAAAAMLTVCVMLAVVKAVDRRRSRHLLPLEPSAPHLRRIAVEWAAPAGSVFTDHALKACAGATAAFLVDGGVGQAVIVAAQARNGGRTAALVLEAPAETISLVIREALPHAHITLPEP